MKLLKKLGSVLMIVAVLLAFAPMTFEGEVYAASMKLNKKTIYMLKGKTYQLKVKNLTKAAVRKVKWKSSNTKIVKVSKSGKLTAKDYGSATVTAKYRGKTLKCKVIVESKAKRNARKLRNYILKYGKKSKNVKNTYYIQKKVYDPDEGEGTNWTYRISANTTHKVLTFTYEMSRAEPPDKRKVTMKIDLISGSSSLKKGVAEYYYLDEYGIDTWEKTFADINTRFNLTYNDADEAVVSGLEVTKFVENEDEDTEVYTDPDKIAEMKCAEYMAGNLKTAFKYWDKLMSGKKGLKKAKIKMNTIGFSKV